MASTQQLKGRIGSVKNTRQITKAMELVSASKMRRAQEHAARSREFRLLARRLLTRLSELTDVTKHPLYAQRLTKRRLHVFITSDRGLAGAYNSNLFRHFTKELIADKEQNVQSKVILIGKQGHRLLSRFEGVDIIAAYDNFPETPTANDIRPVLETVIKEFTDITSDIVDVTYTDFKSSISQVVETLTVLPAVFKPTKHDESLDEAIFEPSPQAVLDSVTERLIEVQLNQAFFEAQASEQSMRMMAMKNATDNANDLIDDLTLAFNTARQGNITQELAEITGGAEAIK